MSRDHYEVRIKPAAQKEIERLPKRPRERVERAILALGDDSRPAGSLKLSGLVDTYRIRVGNYRVIYQIYDYQLVVLVVAVGDRKDIYRR